jgi:hypothetical protein
MSSISPKLPRLRQDPVLYESLRQQVLRRDGVGDVNRVGRCRTWRSTIRNFAATPAMIPKRT